MDYVYIFDFVSFNEFILHDINFRVDNIHKKSLSIGFKFAVASYDFKFIMTLQSYVHHSRHLIINCKLTFTWVHMYCFHFPTLILSKKSSCNFAMVYLCYKAAAFMLKVNIEAVVCYFWRTFM